MPASFALKGLDITLCYNILFHQQPVTLNSLVHLLSKQQFHRDKGTCLCRRRIGLGLSPVLLAEPAEFFGAYLNDEVAQLVSSYWQEYPVELL